jgi:F0F1-type ATP synthase assembly protein I
VDDSDSGGLSSKQRAAFAFLVGAASLGGASALGHQRPADPHAKPRAYTRREKTLLNLAFLAFYLCVGAGLVLGWHVRPDPLGLVIGCFLGLGAASFLLVVVGVILAVESAGS